MGIESKPFKRLLRMVAPDAFTPRCLSDEEVARANEDALRRSPPGPLLHAGMQADEVRGRLAATEILIVEGMVPLRAMMDYVATTEELCQRFERAIMQSVVNCTTIWLLVLCFDFARHDMKTETTAARTASAAANKKPPTPVQVAFRRGGEARAEIMRALRDHFIERAFLRPGLTIMLSGIPPLSPLTPALRAGSGEGEACGAKSGGEESRCPRALAVRLSRCGGFREVLAPWEVLDTYDEQPVPRDPAKWFTTTYEADDQIKFWLTLCLYLKPRVAPPDDALTQLDALTTSFGSVTVPPRMAAGPKIVVLSEDTNILLELLVVLEMISKLPERALPPRPLSACRVCYMHDIVGGYPAKFLGQPDVLDTKPVYIPEVIDLLVAMRVFSSSLESRCERYGSPVFMLMFMVFMSRTHDYYPRVFMSKCMAQGMFFAALRAAQTWSDGRVLELAHPTPDGQLFARALDPYSVTINFPPFVALLKKMGGEHAPQWDGDAEPRAHAARMLLWIAKALNNHCPGWTIPSACERIGMPEVPRFGYEMTSSGGNDSLGTPLPPSCTPCRGIVGAGALTLGACGASLRASEGVGNVAVREANGKR